MLGSLPRSLLGEEKLACSALVCSASACSARCTVGESLFRSSRKHVEYAKRRWPIYKPRPDAWSAAWSVGLPRACSRARSAAWSPFSSAA
ncbi:hypothetical protein Dimus_032310, partial [Dionaea muscipula]